MKTKVSIAIAFIFFLFTPAFAEISLQAEVDKTSISTGDFVTYKLTVNSDEKNTPAPEIPKFSGFNVVSQAQSSSISLAQSQITTALIYTYILAPSAVGKFKIEPSALKIQDKTYSTDAFEIEVIQGKSKPQAQPENKPSPPKEAPSESASPQYTL